MRPSKYEPLENHLKSTPSRERVVTFRFDELNALLGTPLPASAYMHRAWWGNQRETTNRPQAKAWQSAGFEVDSVNQSRSIGWVRFRRSN
jgi:hypothetical protein